MAVIWTGFFGLSACGASIHALYEGDVRFEHCMALDDRAEVKDTIRVACWDEWLKFYTFGQTRDRIEYAKLRTRQLRGGTDFEDPTLASESRSTEAVPEPTSALAPPPMMLVPDAGTSAAPDPSPANSAEPPGAECSRACDAEWLKCQKECVTPMCNRNPCITKCQSTCKDEHAACMRDCFM